MAHYTKTDNKQTEIRVRSTPNTQSTGTPAPTPDTAAAKLARIVRFAETGQYDKALDLLRKAGPDFRFRNALGVCLLRVGRTADAVRIFRDIVLQPGCTWTRPGLPTVYKTNYATALLLSGRPSGCLEILAEVRKEANPTADRLRDAIARWQSTLSFWRRIDWRLNHVDPPNCQIPIDFPPGEFLLAEGGTNPPVHAGTAA